MSVTTYAIHLRFEGAVHFGNAGLDYGKSERSIHNDTLYAAIFNTLAMIGEEKRIPQNSSELNYALSSCFPYYFDGEKYEYFFPRPFAPIFSDISDFRAGGSDARKALKKISFIDKANFFLLCKNGFLPPDAQAVNGEFYTNHPDFNADFKLISSEVYPRVRVSRVEGEDAKPYYIERLFFFDNGMKHSGLYFLFHGNASDLDMVLHALDILKDEGFGTDRKIGHGQFSYSIASFSIPSYTANASISMGLLAPENKNWVESHVVKSAIAGYQMKQRGGWITSSKMAGFRKNDVQMFSPGSVFGLPSDKITESGVMHDVLPKSIVLDDKHPIWRVGKTLLVPINI
jgi:CRISPR type III-A-associated RAMP protein Csm4